MTEPNISSLFAEVMNGATMIIQIDVDTERDWIWGDAGFELQKDGYSCKLYVIGAVIKMSGNKRVQNLNYMEI